MNLFEHTNEDFIVMTSPLPPNITPHPASQAEMEYSSDADSICIYFSDIFSRYKLHNKLSNTQIFDMWLTSKGVNIDFADNWIPSTSNPHF